METKLQIHTHTHIYIYTYIANIGNINIISIPHDTASFSPTFNLDNPFWHFVSYTVLWMCSHEIKPRKETVAEWSSFKQQNYHCTPMELLRKTKRTNERIKQEFWTRDQYIQSNYYMLIKNRCGTIWKQKIHTRKWTLLREMRLKTSFYSISSKYSSVLYFKVKWTKGKKKSQDLLSIQWGEPARLKILSGFPDLNMKQRGKERPGGGLMWEATVTPAVDRLKLQPRRPLPAWGEAMPLTPHP